MNNYDDFWYTNPKILIDSNKITEIFPNNNMELNQKLNAIVRMSIVICIALFTYNKNYLMLYIPLLTLVVTLIVYKANEKENKENFFSQENCTKPTINNPLMNYNIIADSPYKQQACNYDKETKEEINKNLNYNLYEDTSDVFNRGNSQRQFYTMPNTQNPNNQTDFAKWCYETPKTCKEDNLMCYEPNIRLGNELQQSREPYSL